MEISEAQASSTTPQNNGGYFPLPQPDEIPEREREDAMGAYLMMFAAVASALPLPVINLLAAIIYYYVNRRKSRFVHFHALQSLLSQLPTTFLNWGLLYWVIRIFFLDVALVDDAFYGYLYLTIAANVFYVAFSLVAAIKARKGRMYYFLFFGRLSYEAVFSQKRNFRYEGKPILNETNYPPK